MREVGCNEASHRTGDRRRCRRADVVVVTAGNLLNLFRPGDPVYFDSASDDVPAALRGQTGTVDRVEGDSIYVNWEGVDRFPIRLPLSAVRVERRRTNRAG
jgi:hypothetical protein